jgi:peptidoglycan-associated lipoprotein
MTLRRFALILAALSLMTAFGCSSHKPKEDESTSSAVTENADQASGDSDSGHAMGLQTVHFPYDSSNLDSEAKGVLKSNASILKSNSNLKIQIEGHCDARGGIQYNLALGERRAKSVKDYLVDAGVNANRLSTISYGKERLLDPGTNDEANAKNRRANFVVTSK